MASTDAGPRNKARHCVTAVVLLIGFLLAAHAASAEEKKDYALLYGTVWDAGNHAVGGVPVRIQRVGDKKPKWSLVSDARGEFAQRVPPGQNDYIVTAEPKLPKGVTKPQAKVHVEKNERVDFSLHLSK